MEGGVGGCRGVEGVEGVEGGEGGGGGVYFIHAWGNELMITFQRMASHYQ